MEAAQIFRALTPMLGARPRLPAHKRSAKRKKGKEAQTKRRFSEPVRPALRVMLNPYLLGAKNFFQRR